MNNFHIRYFFYKYKLNLSIKKLIKLLNKNNISLEEHYDETTSYIVFVRLQKLYTTSRFIRIFKCIVSYLYKLSYLIESNSNSNNSEVITKIQFNSDSFSKNIKCFISIFIVGLFPNIVCSNKVKHQSSLIRYSKQFIQHLVILGNNKQLSTITLLKCLNSIDSFYNQFKLWKEADINYIVYDTAKTYIEISLNEEINSKAYLISHIQSEKNKLHQHIDYLNNKEAVYLFNNLIGDLKNYDSIIKHLYWIKIDYSLDKEPYDKTVVLNLFMETKRLIKNLVSNRPDIIDELDDVLNDEALTSVLKQEQIDNDYFVIKCYYIIDWIKKLQSPDKDDKLQQFMNQFEEKLKNKEYFKNLIPFFFRYILDELEIIHKQKNEFTKFIKQL